MLIRAWLDVVIDTDKDQLLKDLPKFMGRYEATVTFKDVARNLLHDDAQHLILNGSLYDAIRVEVLD